jgi:REP element-mobilizing transposase RayT
MRFTWKNLLAGFGAASQPNGDKSPRHKYFSKLGKFTQQLQIQIYSEGTSLEMTMIIECKEVHVPVQPNSHRLRQNRYSEPGRAYLITSVVHKRQPVFSDWQTGRLLASQLRQAHEQGLAESIAWVVMPDHFHWLMQLRADDLGDVIGSIKARCTQAVNRKTGRRGPLWQSGYHDRALRDGEDLKPFARYIVANPLRAGLVQKIGDYPLWDACWL